MVLESQEPAPGSGLVSYARAPAQVPVEVERLHQRAWAFVAEPGSWLSGRERVAVAAAVRSAVDCPRCGELRHDPAARPDVNGSHDTPPDLAPLLANVVHAVTTQPEKLSETWFRQVLKAGLEAPRYVEAVGIAALVGCIDTFSRGLGIGLHPLPEPREGAPSRERPDELQEERAWVPIVPLARSPRERVLEPLAMTYIAGAMALARLRSRRGPLRQPAEVTGSLLSRAWDLLRRAREPRIMRSLSLVPPVMRMIRDFAPVHYVPVGKITDPSFDAGRHISRSEMELVSSRASALTECFY